MEYQYLLLKVRKIAKNLINFQKRNFTFFQINKNKYK